MSAASQTSAKAIGSIDEGGYLNGFDRRGFTHPKSLLEIVANILDALDEIDNSPASFHPTGYFDIQRETIRILDNGVGMSEVDAVDMFALHRENNGKRKKKTSRGVSGIGAKAAICILSGKTTVHIYTHKLGGDFLHITVPWEEIFRTKTYTGMVRVEVMTEAEKKAFIKDRATRGMLYGAEAQGTTIVFQYNDKLADVIQDNFLKIRDSDITNPMDRIDIVFGKETVDFCLKHFEVDDVQTLELYDYFKGTEAHFYTGRSVDTIQQYTKGDEERFIWCLEDDKEMEITYKGKTSKGENKYSTEPYELKNNLSGWKYVGDWEVIVGMRVDLSIFNPANPSQLTAGRKVDAYTQRFLCDNNDDSKFGKDSEGYMLYTKLVRNGQRIGLIPPELVSLSSIRGSADSRLKIEYVQCELSFNPTSTQDNPQDRTAQTQENKNQLDGSAMTKRLTRLVEAIKKKKADQIWKYMQDHLRAVEPEEDDSDDEDEDEQESDDDAPAPAPSPVPAPGPAPAPAPAPAPGPSDNDNQEEDSDTEYPQIPSPALPSLPAADVYVELIRLVSSLDRDAMLTDPKWFNLLAALKGC
jgi:hypothetical protein